MEWSGRRLHGYFKEAKPEEPGAQKSLAVVLRERRKDVQRLAAAGAAINLDPAVLFAEAKALAGDAWTNKQSNECKRQDDVLQVKQLEAAARCHLLNHERAEDIDEQVSLFYAAEDKNRAARARLEDRMSERLARPDFHLFGQSVVCTPGLFTQVQEAEIRLRHQMRPAYGDEVDIFVVPDVAEAHPAVKLAACLQGNMIANPVFFSSGGKQGCAVAFAPAILTQRFVYMSYDFRAQHPQCSAVIRRVQQGNRRCKWKVLDTLADWLQRQVDAPKKASFHWALLADREKAAQPALAAHKYALTFDMLLQLVNKIDYSRSALGIGSAS